MEVYRSISRTGDSETMSSSCPSCDEVLGPPGIASQEEERRGNRDTRSGL
jgi:hypothetical protein